MTEDAIRDGWLVLGRSTKAARRLTRSGRLAVGDKGLGRLAALRMGEVAQLCTRPFDEPGREYRLTLDWSQFETAKVVEDVPLDIEEVSTQEPPGTTIMIERLRVRMGRKEIQRLARSLVLLADPFDEQGFRPILIAPGFGDLERKVREAYFDDAEYQLVALLDDQGCASAEVRDWSGRVKWTADHGKISRGTGSDLRPYRTPPAVFDFWAFNVSGQSQTFTPRSSVTELRQWLEAVGGVHLYYRGLRVHPYGDPGFDWLDMNLARARDPEFRPSTNTSLGRVRISDPRDELVQKTDRLGFLETEAFAELRRFVTDALEWLHKERIEERDERKKRQKVETDEAIKNARKELDSAVGDLPADERKKIRRAVLKLEAARNSETRSLREDLQLYRTLGTVGTSAAVFAHEAAKPVTQIEQMAQVIDRRGRREFAQRYDEVLAGPVQLVLSAGRSLRTYTAIPLRLLKREKRRAGPVDVHAVINGIAELFSPFLNQSQIQLDLELVETQPFVYGNVAAIESILANLLTNAINAFESNEATGGHREVVIRTEIVGEDRLLIRALDSGPGIRHLSLDEIWLPGRTTKAGGTGLGLTIVRDTVNDLGGRVFAIPQGELGGAELTMELPLSSGVV